MDNNRWRAAQAAREPVVDGTTHSGLPRRLPQANLVPGSAAGAAGPLAVPDPMLSREPEDVRSRLDSFVSGQEAARGPEDVPGPSIPAPRALPPNPMTAPSPLRISEPSGKSAKPSKPAKPAKTPKPQLPAQLGGDEPWGDGWRTFRPM